MPTGGVLFYTKTLTNSKRTVDTVHLWEYDAPRALIRYGFELFCSRICTDVNRPRVLDFDFEKEAAWATDRVDALLVDEDKV